MVMASNTSNNTYPENHRRLCPETPIRGSIRNGYDRSASRLPALLAEYRKYGSSDAACVVRENQVCTSGAEAETTKKGIAVETARSDSTSKRGCNESDLED